MAKTLKDKISDSNEVKETLFYIASGMEVKDWVDGNDNIFNDNIRGYLGANKVNKSMLKTIDENPEDFFIFNNGITAVTTEINENDQSNFLQITVENTFDFSFGSTILFTQP